MDASRIERKRAHDRESQRINRARNKAYIAHLENAIAELSRGSEDDRATYVPAHVLHQQRKIDTLQGIVAKIRQLAQDACEIDSGSHDQSQSHLRSDVSAPTAGAPMPLNRGPNDHYNGECGIGNQLQTSGRNPFGFDIPNHGPLHETSWSPRLDPYSTNPQSSREGAQCPLECANYFQKLNDAISKVEHSTDPEKFSTSLDDEDIVVRAVTQGWDATEKEHHMDRAWRFLRTLDEGLYFRSGPVERMAKLRLMRSMLLYKIRPHNQPRRPIPPFMVYTTLQQTIPRLAIVDYFAWPTVRDFLIEHRVQYVAESSAINFAINFRFEWPYEVRDIYLKIRNTGRFIFSDAFTNRFNDLNSYGIIPFPDATGVPFDIAPNVDLSTQKSKETRHPTPFPASGTDRADAFNTVSTNVSFSHDGLVNPINWKDNDLTWFLEIATTNPNSP